MYFKLVVQHFRNNCLRRQLRSDGLRGALRGLSSSAGDDSDEENETSRKRKPAETSTDSAKTKKVAISKQLLDQILSMKVSGTSDDGDGKLNLAVPLGKQKTKAIKAKQIEARNNIRSGYDQQMVSAVKDVAKSLGGDEQTIESELLHKLKSHDLQKDETPNASIGALFTGMKIDRTRAPREAPPRNYVGETQRPAPRHLVDDVDRFAHGDKFVKKKSRPGLTDRKHLDLFGASPLNIFSQKMATQESPKLDFPKLETWDALEEREKQFLVTHPFANAFEEMILWTKQGKMWKFPIDNEQGLDEEANVGFHEHVLLEPLISDFPKKGPIRHFMELVLVGLSKNHYLSVQQKKDFIDWFRNYFKEKESVLKSVGALQ